MSDLLMFKIGTQLKCSAVSVFSDKKWILLLRLSKIKMANSKLDAHGFFESGPKILFTFPPMSFKEMQLKIWLSGKDICTTLNV